MQSVCLLYTKTEDLLHGFSLNTVLIFAEVPSFHSRTPALSFILVLTLAKQPFSLAPLEVTIPWELS